MPTLTTQQCIMQQVQAILQVLNCSRRQQKPATTSPTMSAKCMSGDDARKGSDIGDISTDDISEHSRHLSGSSDSDADTYEGNAFFKPPPGLELDGPQQRAAHKMPLSLDRHVARTESTQSHWNPQAPPFVPDAAKNLVALKEALDRLAPNEIATVKSILDSKMCDDVTANSSLQRSRLDGLGAPIARRPFTPFQGCRTQPQQSKRAKDINAAPKPTQNDSSGETLRTFLYDLSLVDNGRVLTLRKISKLGLNSGELLENYFSKFGKVERIMVSHMQCQSNQHSTKTRVRPAALGFALMTTVEEARAVLKHGASHMVAGVEITVLSFQSHSVDGAD